ncbi:hypothetical protein PUN28_008408 [Cardiocondyla obscurior]|uniref:Nucleolar protein 14 n=1 Tax=Cardiocondyla obscurior TaxID=286306 RepID=A0AAW2FXM4_9HYME
MVKIAKKNSSELVHQKRKKQLNPFEVHVNKDKLKVLGRKSKNDRGLPGVSRTRAINKRKQSLLQEYKRQNKDNVFLDKRIGERNSAMSMEDKVTARFATEHMKSYKKDSIFNLNDEVLTHRGQTLEEIEKFDDPRSDDEFSDDENTTGKLNRDFVETAHFGGGILSKADSTLSRRDLIDQLIMESKKRKAEKQKIREQTIDLTEKLDSEWKDLLPLISASKKSAEDPNEVTKADTYDMAVRQLKFEARGVPSDKLKSEEEIVQEEKEKLEKLEADRVARMRGLTSNAIIQYKHKSADDLEDDFVMESIEDESDEADDSSHNDEEEEDEEEDKIENLNMKKNQGTVHSESNSEDESNVDLNNKSLKSENLQENNLSDLEISTEDETQIKLKNKSKKYVTFTNDLTENFNQESQVDQILPKSILKQSNSVQKSYNENEKQQIRNNLLERKEIMEKARKELPYTYGVPESFEELKKLLESHNADYQSVIVDRIIKCNHWTLDGKNREKMSSLFGYLLQYVDNCACTENANDLVKCFQVFDRLCPYFYDLAHANPENSKICIQEMIKIKHDKFEKNRTRYPDMDTLILFKLVSLLFPTSDFRHPVVTPCLIFMSQILLRSRVKKYRSDISKGLFICTLILEYTRLSKRFGPSVINFLRGIIYLATPTDLTQNVKIVPPFKTTCKALVISKTEKKIDPNDAQMFASDLIHEELDDKFKIRVLLTTINLLVELKNQLQELEAVYSIFEPVFKLLKLNKFKKYPPDVRDRVKELCRDLKALRDKKLEYIVVEKKRPKPLRTYEPKMTVYDGKRHKSMSKEKGEREKLLHKYKREYKGAVREIRRDRDFLSKVQIEQQIKSDTERKRKVNEIFGAAALQQSELKKMNKRK